MSSQKVKNDSRFSPLQLHSRSDVASFRFYDVTVGKSAKSRKMPTTSDRPENDNHIRKENINKTDYFTLRPFTFKLKRDHAYEHLIILQFLNEV